MEITGLTKSLISRFVSSFLKKSIHVSLNVITLCGYFCVMRENARVLYLYKKSDYIVKWTRYANRMTISHLANSN